jgi:hypothetical protein
MDRNLENIDILRARLGVSYKEAREALDEAGGDVVQALINLEDEGRNLGERFQARGREMVENLRGCMHRGCGYRVKVKKGQKTVLEFPASVGALGIIGALASREIALLGALGTVAAMANDYTLDFERAGNTGRGNAPDYEIAGENPVEEGI